MKALITGATGFVGTALCDFLGASAYEFVPAVRAKSGISNEIVVGHLDASTDWRSALTGCDAVVHLAARAHVMNDSTEDPMALYRATNTEATLNLARQASQAGVKRFVFIGAGGGGGGGRGAAGRGAGGPGPGGAGAGAKGEA